MVHSSAVIGTAAALGAALVATLAWSEAVHRRAHGRRLGDGDPREGREAVVVLGYRNRGGRANLVNRYRVRAAIRSVDRGRDGFILCCGGPVAGAIPEAELMADYARGIVRGRRPVLVETASRSTWENIQNAIPFVEDAASIKIVSDPLHAEKGRAHLHRLRPDLARRLVAAEEYRFGELVLLKPLFAVTGLIGLRGL
ncbi:MAG: YdcF family protein [Leucobacter sp.]